MDDVPRRGNKKMIVKMIAIRLGPSRALAAYLPAGRQAGRAGKTYANSGSLESSIESSSDVRAIGVALNSSAWCGATESWP